MSLFSRLERVRRGDREEVDNGLFSVPDLGPRSNQARGAHMGKHVLDSPLSPANPRSGVATISDEKP